MVSLPEVHHPSYTTPLDTNSYGLTFEVIPYSKTSDLQAIIDVLNAHHPVIALIHGAVLNREIPQHPS